MSFLSLVGVWVTPLPSSPTREEVDLSHGPANPSMHLGADSWGAPSPEWGGLGRGSISIPRREAAP
jgi:hypothetical protein